MYAKLNWGVDGMIVSTLTVFLHCCISTSTYVEEEKGYLVKFYC